METTTYYLGLIKKGPTWAADETPEIDRLQAAHLAHIQALRAAGKIVVAGPLLDDGFLRGITSSAPNRSKKRSPSPPQTRW